MNIILNFICTAFTYLFMPFLIFFRKVNNFDNKKIKIILILNSIIIKIIWIAIEIAIYGDVENLDFTPAILYFGINMLIWSKKNNNNNNNNNKTSKNEEEQKNKNNKKKKRKINQKTLMLFLIISIAINIFLTAGILYYNNITKKHEVIIKKNNLEKSNLKKEKNELKDSLNYILNGKTELYVQQKLKFFDNNIVFVVNGYNNYLSYDCLRKTFDGKKYSYWAYNREAAISKGYKEYKCN